MKHPRLLYGSVSVLGIVFLAAFFLIPMFFTMSMSFSLFFSNVVSVLGLLIWFLFSIVGVVFITAGVCGIGSQYLRNKCNLSAQKPELAGDSKKHTKLYRFIAVLGIAFLGVFLTIIFGSASYHEVSSFISSTPHAVFLIFSVFLFGGTGLLTVGVCGIAGQYFKNNKSFFTILVAILIPSLILMPVFYLWVGALTVNF